MSRDRATIITEGCLAILLVIAIAIVATKTRSTKYGTVSTGPVDTVVSEETSWDSAGFGDF